MYVAIIGNLVGSRQKNDCREIDPQLTTILDQINGIYHDQLASRFCLTRADSFQGLLESPEEVMNILFQLKFQLHPAKIRFGIGLGDVSTQNDSGQSDAVAPVWQAARRMLDEVKRKEAGKKALHLDMLFGHLKDNQSLDSLNAGLCLMHFLETGWTDKQWVNIYDSLILGLNQSEIAQQRGVNQSTIHRSLNSAGYYEYEQAFHTFQNLLDRMK